MNPEEPIDQTEQPTEPITEQPPEQTETTQTTETVGTTDNSEMLVAMQNLNDTMTWNFAVQWIIIGLLFFILVFQSIQAGKN